MPDKKRYCAKMMYLGSGYNGYQIQPNGITIQGVIEDAMSMIYQEPIGIVGCGRTDTGVNAKDYYFHFDTSFPNPHSKLYGINGIVGNKICIVDIKEVQSDFHARYDANLRGYQYFVHTEKNPFLQGQSFYLPLGQQILDVNKMYEAAEQILHFEDFYTFCKSNSDAKNTICKIKRSEWQIDERQLKYTIHGNRFLRGMVRMIVGAMINIGLGKMDVKALIFALENKERLENSWSVPAQGLYLYLIEYPHFKM